MDLPLELKNEILRRIPVKEYPKIALACQSLSSDLKNEYLWQHIYNRKGLGTYKRSYLDSIKYYKKRWQWRLNGNYVVREEGSLINYIKRETFQLPLHGKKALRKNTYTKIRIETAGYLYISLETRLSNLSIVHCLKSDNLGVYIFGGINNRGNFEKVSSQSLKEGDEISIITKGNMPVFELNGQEIELYITEERKLLLQSNSLPLYPMIVLGPTTTIRIIV